MLPLKLTDEQNELKQTIIDLIKNVLSALKKEGKIDGEYILIYLDSHFIFWNIFQKGLTFSDLSRVVSTFAFDKRIKLSEEYENASISVNVEGFMKLYGEE